MTPDEFEFWQKAYLTALTGQAGDVDRHGAAHARAIDEAAALMADLAAESYRTAKATVVQTTYATGDYSLWQALDRDEGRIHPCHPLGGVMLGRFNIKVTGTHVLLDYCDNGTYIAYRECEAETTASREGVEAAINFAVRFGGIEGDHHKAWVIDQMVRALAGDGYEKLVKDACGDDYRWEVGIAP